MELQDLTVTTREKVGKGAVQRARESGLVPSVLYGTGQEPLSLSVDRKTFELLLHGDMGENAVLQINVEGHPELSSPALIKEIQRHPIRESLVHADFLRIRLDEKIQTFVSVQLVGRSVGIIEGGVLDHQLRQLEIECLAINVPSVVEIDISELDIGGSIHVAEIAEMEDVTILTESDRTVCTVHAPRVVVEEVEEELEGEEGEEGEGEEGEEKEGEEKADDAKEKG